jgi:hypothetical protein
MSRLYDFLKSADCGKSHGKMSYGTGKDKAYKAVHAKVMKQHGVGKGKGSPEKVKAALKDVDTKWKAKNEKTAEKSDLSKYIGPDGKITVKFKSQEDHDRFMRALSKHKKKNEVFTKKKREKTAADALVKCALLHGVAAVNARMENTPEVRRFSNEVLKVASRSDLEKDAVVGTVARLAGKGALTAGKALWKAPLTAWAAGGGAISGMGSKATGRRLGQQVVRAPAMKSGLTKGLYS